jgi:hypothetical protein
MNGWQENWVSGITTAIKKNLSSRVSICTLLIETAVEPARLHLEQSLSRGAIGCDESFGRDLRQFLQQVAGQLHMGMEKMDSSWHAQGASKTAIKNA